MATATPAEAEKKSGGMKKILVLGVVLALLGGGAWFFLLRDTGPKEPEPGEVLTLEPVHINLAGGGYLKVGLALQMTADAGGHGEPNGAQALDLAISQFSQVDPGKVTEDREKMKHELEEKIIEAYHHEVLHVFYTEYVTQ